jgi:hypothetical protein
VPALPAGVPSTADRYAVLIMGNPAGQQAVWTAPDGALHIFYQFNDRGRGPKTTSILKLDAKGLPIAETVEGNDYLKSPGSRNLRAGVRYRPLEERSRRRREENWPRRRCMSRSTGAPAELGILAQAALRKMAAMSICCRKARPGSPASRNWTSKQRPRKSTSPCTRSAGLDFSPTYIWLDDRRTASSQPWIAWSTVIPEGWEATAKIVAGRTGSGGECCARPSCWQTRLTGRPTASCSRNV